MLYFQQKNAKNMPVENFRISAGISFIIEMNYGLFLHHTKAVSVRISQNRVIGARLIVPINTGRAETNQPIHFGFAIICKQIDMVTPCFWRGDKLLRKLDSRAFAWAELGPVLRRGFHQLIVECIAPKTDCPPDISYSPDNGSDLYHRNSS